jgi:hypothetical protein
MTVPGNSVLDLLISPFTLSLAILFSSFNFALHLLSQSALPRLKVVLLTVSRSRRVPKKGCCSPAADRLEKTVDGSLLAAGLRVVDLLIEAA